MTANEEVPNFAVVTLCGSVRFREDFEREAARLTLEGYIVLMPNVWDHHDYFHNQDMPEMIEKKRILDQMYFRKILMSDWVVVINRDGYIGHSTGREIGFATEHNIPVLYMNGHPLSINVLFNIKNNREVSKCQNNQRRKKSQRLRLNQSLKK